jgi:hypothetical protein
VTLAALGDSPTRIREKIAYYRKLLDYLINPPAKKNGMIKRSMPAWTRRRTETCA